MRLVPRLPTRTTRPMPPTHTEAMAALANAAIELAAASKMIAESIDRMSKVPPPD